MSGEQRQVDLGGETLTVTIKRSAQRRRRLSLSLDAKGEALLRVPLKTANKDIEAMLEKHRDWLHDKTRELHRYRQANPALAFVSGETLTLQGKTLRLEVNVAPGAVRWTVVDDRLVLRTPNQDRDVLMTKLRAWYRQQAMVVFPQRLALWSERIPWVEGVPPLRVRQMRSRWGSCSSKGGICLNSELIRLDPELLDYVIVHELCHLQEFNHSPRFYALMARHFPNWQHCRERLANTSLRALV